MRFSTPLSRGKYLKVSLVRQSTRTLKTRKNWANYQKAGLNGKGLEG
jgi:hypothetical protein